MRKNIYLILMLCLIAGSQQLFANCTSAGDCTTQKQVSICPTVTIQGEDFSQSCADLNTYSVAGNAEIYYTINIATPNPLDLYVTISNSTNPVYIGFNNVDNCVSFPATEGRNIPATCAQVETFDLSGFAQSIYYIVVEGTGTFDITFGLEAMDKVSVPCARGDWGFDDINACGTPALTSSNSSFGVCLNGNPISTDGSLTYDLAPASNQLCITTAFRNMTGGRALRALDFDFGTDLSAIPTTQSCDLNVAIQLMPNALLPAQNGGNGNWLLSDYISTPQSVTWGFDDAQRGDMTDCDYTCALYEFCFEVTASSNNAANTRVDITYHRDNYSRGDMESCSCTACRCLPCTVGGGGDDGSLMNMFDPVPVPVELLDFDVNWKDKAAYLSWTTASEEASSHFEIERSADAKNWEAIDKVSAAGTSFSTTKYEVVDVTPLNGISYYRLNMVDLDGSQAYSPIVTLETDLFVKSFRLAPNPAIDVLWVSLEEEQEDVLISIYSHDGGKVAKYKYTDKSKAFELDISALPQGVYYLSTIVGTKTVVRKILIMNDH